MQAGMVGRTRHGLWTKYVDAYRASSALAGDYSPRTVRILPRQNAFGKRCFLSVGCLVDTEAVGLVAYLAVAKCPFDQRLVAQEAVGDQAHFAPFSQMNGRFF